MRCASLPPPRDRRSRASSGAVRFAQLCSSALGVTIACAGPVLAQTPFLRGGLEETRILATDDDAIRRTRTETPSGAVDADLSGLGEVVSPLDRRGVARSSDVLGGGSTARPNDPATAPVETPVETPAVAAASSRPRPQAKPKRAPVAPTAAAGTVEGAGPVTATAAIRPATVPADPLAAEAEKEDDAYAPLGLRSGGMTWYPAVEAAIGHTSNADSSQGGRGATVWSIAPELIGRSDWSRHSLEVTVRGNREAYVGAGDLDRTEFETQMRGRVDLGDLTRADLTARWSRKRESTSANEAATAGSGTDRVIGGASLGVTRDVGLFALTLRGELERNQYVANDALGSGSTDPSVQDNVLWSGAIRTTLGPTHSLAPFVEVRASARRYDAALVYGHRRDGDGVAAVVGVTADAGPMLRGEIATGWGTEKPADASLSTMSGWLVEGNMTWSPTRLVVVKTKLASTFEPTTNAGSPGAMARTASLDANYALRRDLTVSAGVGYDTKHYYGIDVDERTATVSAGLIYKFDRNFQTFARARFEHTTASNAAAYDTATVLVGVRVQR